MWDDSGADDIRKTGNRRCNRPPPDPRRAAGTSLAAVKRILIVNAYMDEFHRLTGTPYRAPQAMAPAFLAGAFAPDLCEIRLYNEQRSGALTDVGLLSWPDMLVLTGLTISLDRMFHLTAYARTLNRRIVVVAGGPPIRALPAYASHFFDYACTGDIEQLQEVIREVFGRSYVAAEMFPRFDLVQTFGRIGYVESSRNCNFRCAFCALTGEGGSYRPYDIGYMERQIHAAGRKHILFIDNNFYGNDRSFFLDRVALLKDLFVGRRIKGWAALVTGDFFRHSENLTLVRQAGCHSLFSGVESFDAATLSAYNKRQNFCVPQVDMIKGCLESGVNFIYGLMVDITNRPLADLRREIEFIVNRPEITLPAFITASIPLLGTPYFRQCVTERRLMPNLRLSDFNGGTITEWPLDPIPDVARFLHDLDSFKGFRRQALSHTVRFARRYAGRLAPTPFVAALANGALRCAPTLVMAPREAFIRKARRSHVGTTELLHPLYRPSMAVADRYRAYFSPTMITDRFGALTDPVVADLTRGLGDTARVPSTA